MNEDTWRCRYCEKLISTRARLNGHESNCLHREPIDDRLDTFDLEDIPSGNDSSRLDSLLQVRRDTYGSY